MYRTPRCVPSLGVLWALLLGSVYAPGVTQAAGDLVWLVSDVQGAPTVKRTDGDVTDPIARMTHLYEGDTIQLPRGAAIETLSPELDSPRRASGPSSFVLRKEGSGRMKRAWTALCEAFRPRLSTTGATRIGSANKALAVGSGGAAPAVELQYPLNTAIRDLPVRFRWSAPNAHGQYRLRIYRMGSGQPVVDVAAIGTAHTFTEAQPVLRPGNQYVWTIVPAIDADKKGQTYGRSFWLLDTKEREAIDAEARDVTSRQDKLGEELVQGILGSLYVNEGLDVEAETHCLQALALAQSPPRKALWNGLLDEIRDRSRVNHTVGP